MAKKTTLNELGEMLAHVVEHMATKEDIVSVNKTLDDHTKLLNDHTTILTSLSAQVASIERELKSIRRQLNVLSEKVENVVVYRKEIDHALQRITAIEKHLGLNKKIAA